MERKTWVMPMTLVQKFEANETVAAQQCYRVACDVSDSKVWENEKGQYYYYWGTSLTPTHEFTVDHGFNGCRNINNQYIQVNDGTVQMMENSSVSRSCVFYTNDTYGTQTSNPSIAPGEYVYWTTQQDVYHPFHTITATWHHKGEIQLASPNHPNQS